MADLYQLARDLGYVSAEMHAEGHRYAGGVQQAARVLLELADLPVPSEDGCRRCGAQLTQPATGRKRTWCSDRCRKGRTKPAETAR